MKKLDQQTALSILFANTKRKKRKVDLITIAEACDYLVKLYGSQTAVADKVGLNSEMIREFRKLIKLPDEVKKLVSSRRIDRLDVAYRISMVEDPKKQIAIANQLTGLSDSKDIRDVLRLAQTTGLSLRESKRVIMDSKPKGLHMFIVDFDDKTYNAITAEAKAAGISAAELVREIVTNHIFKGKVDRED